MHMKWKLKANEFKKKRGEVQHHQTTQSNEQRDRAIRDRTYSKAHHSRLNEIVDVDRHRQQTW